MKQTHKSSNVVKDILLALLAVIMLTACNNDKSYTVIIKTPYGNMKALLYDDTPAHRDNFVRLVLQHKYDSLLFHRVVRNHLIQGGDPQSRNAGPNDRLGRASMGSNVRAEIVYPTHFHKRGALCAARATDDVNPDKESSGSQFYIVQGTIRSDVEMDNAEVIHDNISRRAVYQDILHFYEDSLQYFQSKGMAQELADLQVHIFEQVERVVRDRGLFKYPEEVREVYRTQGGMPELDGDYTVFGEIIEGLDIIDSIAKVAVSPYTMRPADDIRMAIVIDK